MYNVKYAKAEESFKLGLLKLWLPTPVLDYPSRGRLDKKFFKMGNKNV